MLEVMTSCFRTEVPNGLIKYRLFVPSGAPQKRPSVMDTVMQSPQDHVVASANLLDAKNRVQLLFLSLFALCSVCGSCERRNSVPMRKPASVEFTKVCMYNENNVQYVRSLKADD